MYCFDKDFPEKGVHKISSKKLHKKLNLYTQFDEHGCRDISVEKSFSYLEGKAGEVFKRIIDAARNGKAYKLDHCEKEVMARFFFHQVGRTPDFQDYILRYRAEKENKDVETIKREIGPEYMFHREIERVIRILEEKNFTVVKISNPKKSFVIGSFPILRLPVFDPDNPVCLSNPCVELWLPIAYDVALVLFSREIERLLIIKDPLIRKINEGIFKQSSATAGRSAKLIESLSGTKHRDCNI